MTYELAKKLKDAGFPTSNLWHEDEHHGVRHFYPDASLQPEIPTLEELIKACGKKFLNVRHMVGTDTWIAYAQTNILGVMEFEGPTPSEAVANLWLALNQK